MSAQRQPRQSEPNRRIFFKAWLEDPFHVASVAPSGRSLARLMAAGIEPTSLVVELGPGTGTLTDAILCAGVDPAALYLVEQNERFVELLRVRFPGANVVHADAETLAEALPQLEGKVDYVISGLPILWFNRAKKERILRQALGLMHAQGRLHQFTYLGRPPMSDELLASVGLNPRLLGISPLNLPPAFVYRFERAVGGGQ